MEQTKNVGLGLIAVISAICLFETWVLQNLYLSPWIAWTLFLVLAFPFAINLLLAVERFRARKPVEAKVKQTKNVLMALQGFGFAGWFFDVISTIFILDIKHLSFELNPLGWPLSAIGALVYFVPTTFVVYYLLFKRKSKETFYSAVIVTGVSIFMGLRNLGAGIYNLSGLGNFNSFTEDFLILGIWSTIAIILTALNIISIVKCRRKIEAQKALHFNLPLTDVTVLFQRFFK